MSAQSPQACSTPAMQLCNLPVAHGLHHKAHGPEVLQSWTKAGAT